MQYRYISRRSWMGDWLLGKVGSQRLVARHSLSEKKVQRNSWKQKRVDGESNWQYHAVDLWIMLEE